MRVSSKKINKIGFYLVDQRQYDFYKNIISTLSANQYELVLNDFNEKERSGLIQLAEQNKHPYQLARTIIKNSLRYKVIVGTGNSAIKVRNINIKQFVLFLYANTVGNVLLKTGISSLLYKLTNRSLLAKAHKNKSGFFKRISPESVLGITKVCFPRGMDVKKNHPGKKKGKLFDVFFCHGYYDQELIKKNVGKRTFLIGYPRYDDFFKNKNRINPFAKEFDLKADKKTIIWLPSRVDWQTKPDENIFFWLEAVALLKNKYNIVCRPHPHRLRDNKALATTLEEKGVIVDKVSHRNMSCLYASADYIFCDYGGTIFSALYFDKKTVLLNHPEHSSNASTKSLDFKIRESFCSVLPEDISGDKSLFYKTLENEALWQEQKAIRKEWQRKLFGGIPPGEGSEVASGHLLSLMDKMEEIVA